MDRDRSYPDAIRTEADLAAGLERLVEADPRLLPVHRVAGPVTLRRRPGGFAGLAAIVTAQQVSATAAAAIWSRLAAAVDPFTPELLLAAGEAQLRKAGLSRPKIRTLIAVAGECRRGLDIDGLAELLPHEAIRRLTALHGIGPWTAEIYLLFCLGHPDIFPAGDLALRTAVQHALGLHQRPSEKALRSIAEAWSPWRGAAAHLFWAYYKATRRHGRERHE